MRIAVYTASFGQVEMFDPVVINKNIDYLYFTDQNAKSYIWQVVNINRMFTDPRRESRFYFDQSIRNLPDYDITIMHGANAQLTIDPLELVDLFLDADIAAFRHPHRNCVYKEAGECKRMGKDAIATIDVQMERYREEGFPENHGLHACGLLIRRNTLDVKHFESLWFDEVLNGSCRDQLSFDYAVWKTGIRVTDIPGNIFCNNYLKVNKH